MDARRCLTFILLLLMTSAVQASSAGGKIEMLVEALSSVHHQTRAALIVQRYRELYPAGIAERATARYLRSRFEAAEVAAFYSHDSSLADELLQLHVALANRGASTPGDAQAVLGTLILVRKLEDARIFGSAEGIDQARQLPVLERAAPAGGDSPSLLRISGGVLLEEPVDLASGTRVVVVANPACYFSQRADAAIANDGPLAEELQRSALWIVPPSRDLQLDTLRAWNDAHPRQRMFMVYRTIQWSFVDDWSTPVFYVLDDGKLAAKITGWPDDNRSLELLRAALKIDQRPGQ